MAASNRLTATMLRRARAVLRDRTGSTAEAIVATWLMVAVVTLVTTGVVSGLGVLATTSSNAERTQQINTMVNKPADFPEWAGATTTAAKQNLTLPSGATFDTYLWSVPEATGIRYFAAIPRSGNNTAWTDCGDIAVVHTTTCLYAESFQATDPRSVVPANVAGLTKADFTAAVPPGTAIATVTAPAVSPEVWRYYLDATATGAAGTVRILQGTVILATIPVGSDPGKYFGTITATPGLPLVLLSNDRPVTIQKLLVYKAGS